MAIYPIEFPAIPSSGIYFFETESGIRYEVRFARRKNNLLHVTIAFGVVNDEFDGEEYSETNRGEVFSVMQTIAEVVRKYQENHEHVRLFEFTAQAKESEDDGGPNQRMGLYKRYLSSIFDINRWNYKVAGNHMLIERKGS
jgi:hypothetical protein